MYNFEFYAPTRVVFGRGTESQAGALVKEYGGTSVLIHYGGGSAVRSGLIQRVRQSLDEAGVSYVELGGVVPNPHLSLVYQGIELCRKAHVDFVLAVGGGSVIDSAKAIAYGLANDGDVWDFYCGKRKPQDCMPVGCVLTIAAAGSEMSNSSVITKEDEGLKRSCNTNLARAKFAIMNPELTMTLPDWQTQAGCTDIMMHTMERYFTQGGNMEITDSIAEGLLRTVMKYAVILHAHPEQYEARAEIMWAGSLSHNGLTGCGNDGGDFSCHKLEHELSGMFDVTHGAGLAAIWGTWARYVYRDCLPRFVRFARQVMGVSEGPDDRVALAGIEQMESFYHSIGMPISIHELGITPTDDQLKQMARLCARGCGGHQGSAKVLDEEDMYRIYKAAL
ncbi:MULTISPECIES: iron-containing alcohol dehydrogenase [unclassified Megasphaera]|uniref:iron-containing alcohol dehydrogenase n=1 Tax=unclassified Megasphaera TaxID=2626256 RepID=UPI0025C1B803|nr:iron-containing alcohol dehydrogenase [Megasphaera sp. UBA4233]